ncbi:hypothetical protein E2P81_ATG01935 [Venturia nashicola]|nr:hypothetical protein E2P81_ATG01935 [Venturia nashicola]
MSVRTTCSLVSRPWKQTSQFHRKSSDYVQQLNRHEVSSSAQCSSIVPLHLHHRTVSSSSSGLKVIVRPQGHRHVPVGSMLTMCDCLDLQSVLSRTSQPIGFNQKSIEKGSCACATLGSTLSLGVQPDVHAVVWDQA